MNITHINSYFITSPLHAELVSKLDEKGIHQVVFVPVQQAKDIGVNNPPNLKYSTLLYDHCFNTTDRFIWPLKIIKTWRSFKKQHKTNPPSIIHAHTLIVNGLIAFLANKKWGIPYIVTIRETDVYYFLKKSYIFRKIGERILKAAAAIIVLSQAYQNIHLPAILNKKLLNLINIKVSVIPNGINSFWIENRQRKKTSDEKPSILFLGQIIKRKNLKNLILAFELLKRNYNSITLTVIGDGPLLAQIRNQTHSPGVRFLGHIKDRTQILELFRSSDILVVPSFRETFGLVYPEAMSQGLPVIYTKDQGFDGFFEDGQVGFAVNPHSPRDIAEKILRIFDDYERISNNAYEASKEFNWDEIADKLLKIYSKTLNHKQ